MELCQAWKAAGIPWDKLNNPILKGFLEKYMEKSIPDESTLRKNYLPKLHEQVKFSVFAGFHYFH